MKELNQSKRGHSVVGAAAEHFRKSPPESLLLLGGRLFRLDLHRCHAEVVLGFRHALVYSLAQVSVVLVGVSFVYDLFLGFAGIGGLLVLLSLLGELFECLFELVVGLLASCIVLELYAVWCWSHDYAQRCLFSCIF